MDDMFQEFYASENSNGYTAANILSAFWISEKKAFENLVTTKEQDAHEFFQFLAEELHERNGDGKRPEIGSEHSCNCIVHQTFYGKMQTTTTCQSCKGTTNAVQSFLDLSLGLENLALKRKKAAHPGLTLKDCLDEEYVKSDKCEYRCHKCDSNQQARRQTSIKRLPNVLSIQLKVSCIPDTAKFEESLRKSTYADFWNSDLNSNRAGVIARRAKSTRRCGSRCSLTCFRTRTARRQRLRTAATFRTGVRSSSGRVRTTC